MALTESTMVELGSSAPDFLLPSTDGVQCSLADFADARFLVLMFICNHCPYVIHIAPALKKLSDTYLAKGVAFVAISSNDAESYPADGFDAMVQEKQQRGYAFPYLYDADQSVAKAYNAACTPDIYVFDEQRKLQYRGQFDDSRPTRISSGNYRSDDGASGASLQAALDILLAGESISGTQYPSIGCNIKWK